MRLKFKQEPEPEPEPGQSDGSGSNSNQIPRLRAAAAPAFKNLLAAIVSDLGFFPNEDRTFFLQSGSGSAKNPDRS